MNDQTNTAKVATGGRIVRRPKNEPYFRKMVGRFRSSRDRGAGKIARRPKSPTIEYKTKLATRAKCGRCEGSILGNS
jgi:hypothetical protein